MIKPVLTKQNLSKQDIIDLLALKNKAEIEELFAHANDLTRRTLGNQVFLRGLIEFSNICNRDCKYCGIRKSNKEIDRYQMSMDEILKAAEWIYEQGFGSLVLQSGERSDPDFINFVDQILKEIKILSNNKLGITLSVGEQSLETYQRWFNSGAHRFLLRVETTNEKLYKKIHPGQYSLKERISALHRIKKSGYQVGTGIMIGLPGQSFDDLADDLIFMQEKDIDMIGMGPYIPHENTPMANSLKDFNKEEQLELALKMIAVTRIHLRDVNIASTTALGALHPHGKKMGLESGGNVIMPNLTPRKYQDNYKLYEDKPAFLASFKDDFENLKLEIKAAGKEIGFHKWGDSPHFYRRTRENQV